jgi:hypothetical protein
MEAATWPRIASVEEKKGDLAAIVVFFDSRQGAPR